MFVYVTLYMYPYIPYTVYTNTLIYYTLYIHVRIGEKDWVQHGNLWMQETILDYLRLGRSKKVYIKDLRTSQLYSKSPLETTTGLLTQIDITHINYTLPKDLFSPNIRSFDPSLLVLPTTVVAENDEVPEARQDKKGSLKRPRSPSPPVPSTSAQSFNPPSTQADRYLSLLTPSPSNPTTTIPTDTSSSPSPSSVTPQLKVLDVGSCYNPFLTGPYSTLFDITALDLCPTDPTVYQSDFLTLKIGPNSSEPLILNGSVDGTDKPINRLIQLPEHTYHAVTMSLVLNYLPTPITRLNMVRRARKLLVHAGSYDILQVYKAKNTPTTSTTSTTTTTTTTNTSSTTATTCTATATTIGHTYTDVQPTTNTNDNNIINSSSSGECILYTDLPYYSGLLVVFEKLSLFPNNRQLSDRFMKHWKAIICREGFIFVRYESIACGAHRSHGMVFRTNTAEEYLNKNRGENRGKWVKSGEIDVSGAGSDEVLSATTADSVSNLQVPAVVGDGSGESSVVGVVSVCSDVSTAAASVVELNSGKLFEDGLWTQQDLTDEHRQQLKGGV